MLREHLLLDDFNEAPTNKGVLQVYEFVCDIVAPKQMDIFMRYFCSTVDLIEMVLSFNL